MVSRAGAGRHRVMKVAVRVRYPATTRVRRAPFDNSAIAFADVAVLHAFSRHRTRVFGAGLCPGSPGGARRSEPCAARRVGQAPRRAGVFARASTLWRNARMVPATETPAQSGRAFSPTSQPSYDRSPDGYPWHSLRFVSGDKGETHAVTGHSSGRFAHATATRSSCGRGRYLADWI